MGGVALDCRQGICQAVPCDEIADCPSSYDCEGGTCARCVESGPEGPTGEPGCTDGVDNDCDGLVDADDTDCAFACATDEECQGDNLCDGVETCDGGVCKPGLPVDCSDLNDPASCLVGECVGATGACEQRTATDGTLCDDGLFCTVDEACEGGACGVGEPNGCEAVIDACNPTATCDELVGACVPVPVECAPDDNPCTAPGCDPALGCNPPAPDGIACDDGLYCTTTDACASGECAGAGSPCDDVDECTADTCDEDANTCVFTPVIVPGAEGPPGDPTCENFADDDCDGLVDLGDPECNTCETASDCDDGSVCTADSCAGGMCSNGPIGGSPSCDDGNACTTGDACTGGVCSGTPAPCADDGNACTDEVCDPGTGCSSVPNALPCEGVYACTLGDACADGACVAGSTPVICADDGNACTDEACEESAGGCTSVPNAAPCEDGDACTLGDACSGGACIPGAVADCTPDGNACTDDACQVGSGCSYPALGDGADCGNGSVCDGAETCAGGACVAGTPLSCSPDGSPCTSDVCDAALGCNPPVADGTSCSDGSFCNGAETCSAGACAAGAAPCAGDGIACTLDCDEIAGCVTTPDDSLCDPGQSCEPACFTGATGCGTAPTGIDVACASPVANEGGSGSSACTATLDAAGLSGCLSCAAAVGIDTVAYADFSAGGSCSLDGWSSTDDGYNCPIDSGALAGTQAIESEDDAISGPTNVVIERDFDLSGYDHAALCWQYGDRRATSNDWFVLELLGNCGDAVLTDAAGPVQGVDSQLFPYCVLLDAFDSCALGSGVLVRFTLYTDDSSIDFDEEELFLDEVAVLGWTDACVTETVVLSDAAPCGPGPSCDAAGNGWTVESTDTVNCMCGSAAYGDLYWANGASSSSNDWTMSRTVDVSGLSGDIWLSFGFDEVDGDEGSPPEGLTVEARATTSSSWVTVFAYEGDVNAENRLVPVAVGLTERLGATLDGSSTLGIRFRARANDGGDGGPTDGIVLDNIIVAGLSYTCSDGSVSVGAVTDAGGGSYTFTATSSAAQRAQMTCAWGSPAILDDTGSVEYRP